MANKNKSKKSKSKSAVAPTKRKIARQPSIMTQNNLRHVRGAFSILDPFCVEARAAKRPDGAGGASFGFSVKGMYNISTDANGKAFTIISPGLGKFGTNDAVYTPATWTTAAAWGIIPGSTFLNNNAGEVRIVSFGVRFISTASMTNCQGLLSVFTLQNPLCSQVYSNSMGNYADLHVTSLTSGKQVCWTSRPMGANAHNFRPFSEATNTMTNFDWTSFAVEVAGGPVSASVGYLDIIVNVEFTPSAAATNTQSGLQGSLAKPIPASPLVLQAQTKVHSMIPTIIEGGVDQLEKMVTKAASEALNSFGAAAMAFLA